MTTLDKIVKANVWDEQFDLVFSEIYYNVENETSLVTFRDSLILKKETLYDRMNCK